MFESVPDADTYIMKVILHGWNVDEWVQILQKQHQAAKLGGRVSLLEHVIPDPAPPQFSRLIDIKMMCWGTGRENARSRKMRLY